ncbi:MAG: BON domain-containing protein, partial [Acidimicrobiia bacterium]
MRRFRTRTLAVGAVLGGAVLLGTEPGRRALRRAVDRAERRGRYLRGVGQGTAYRIRGRRPDPDVSDDILTQRVRSALGGLEKRHDLPHVHVMVEDGLVLLHGELPTAEDVREIELRVLEVSGGTALISVARDPLGRSRRGCLRGGRGPRGARGPRRLHRPHPRRRAGTVALPFAAR